MSPFKALYGTDPPCHQLNSVESLVTMVEDMLLERKEMNAYFQNQLAIAKNKMKQWADKKRTAREFQVLDWVYLRLQPYRQKSLGPWCFTKLSPRFFGSFQIIEKIGAVAYKLALPAESVIHPLFHVSLLKNSAFLLLGAMQTLPPLKDGHFFNGHFEVFPETRTSYQGDMVVPQLLIKWQYYPSVDSTWKDASFIAQQFSALYHSWGKECAKGEGIVTYHPEIRGF
ncbi:hypothetical protein MANES_13G125601v8 [Manihot esculenta]|uniref:Uncharacterized protein n=1 Tax=Manihot esculenta TaxID=3983 RepID=A0ACB7GNC2_MANES|nr:hypothetical protein MANES_13G125601v8 [Manihot esculenta]